MVGAPVYITRTGDACHLLYVFTSISRPPPALHPGEQTDQKFQMRYISKIWQKLQSLTNN